MFQLLNGPVEKVAKEGLKEGLNEAADKLSASHLVFADKVSATLNKQMGDFVHAFSVLGVAFLLLGSSALYSSRNSPNKPSPKPLPTSPPRKQQTTPTVPAVAEDAKSKTASPSSDGGESAAGTERNVLDHEKTVLTQKAAGV